MLGLQRLWLRYKTNPFFLLVETPGTSDQSLDREHIINRFKFDYGEGEVTKRRKPPNKPGKNEQCVFFCLTFWGGGEIISTA